MCVLSDSEYIYQCILTVAIATDVDDAHSQLHGHLVVRIYRLHVYLEVAAVLRCLCTYRNIC